MKRPFPLWIDVAGLVFGVANVIVFYLAGHRAGMLGFALLAFACGLGLVERGVSALGGWTVARPGWTTGPFVRLYLKMGSLIVLMFGIALREFWAEGFRSNEFVALGLAALLVVVTIRAKEYVLRHQDD
jgi:hypothetical protein